MPVSHIKDVVYGKGGEIPLLLDLVIPEGPPQELRPLVVWIHGGGWLDGDKSTNNFAWLASHGYVVASVEYRLSPVAYFPAMVHDCKAAIRFLRANHRDYGIDPNLIGVAGESAGGHLALLLGMTEGIKELEGDCGSPNSSSQVQAVCDYFGPTDLTTPIGGFVELHEATEAALGGPLAEKMEVARMVSPITYVGRGCPPTLIIHGDNDDIVPMEQSEVLYEGLSNAGVDVKLLKVRNGGHGFLAQGLEPTLEEINDIILDFFDRTLERK